MLRWRSLSEEGSSRSWIAQFSHEIFQCFGDAVSRRRCGHGEFSREEDHGVADADGAGGGDEHRVVTVVMWG